MTFEKLIVILQNFGKQFKWNEIAVFKNAILGAPLHGRGMILVPGSS